ncbi:Unsaturated rhamnogalacturonyl hydrolase YteR [termite gut metagenome]|uniref:Unsaturated rhamnogalacturonyl hydrolase YteR n=1 Tax=termite gut metagenome TaxID=433724 RepID=A0A5J4S829_9ZZZZ
MKKVISVLLLLSLCIGSIYSQNKKDRQLIDRVASWQIENHSKSKHNKLDWTNGALYRGMVEWAYYTDNQRYFDFLLNIGDKHNWSLLPRVYHADDLAVGQTYIRLYEKYKNEKMIEAVKERLDSIAGNPSKAQLWLGAKRWSDRWSWCDALFMAPPVYTLFYNIHSEQKYLDFMDKEYQECVDSLYSKEQHLFYRDQRYISKREKNGANVFWGRGNGWVFGGLPFILNDLSESHPRYSFYLNLYREMADAVVDCQDKKGSWHASLLDPASYPSPENSASSFFVYGLAWGVNKGILQDAKYKKAIKNGWKALKSYVDKEGKLGYVQPVGAAPEDVTSDMTDVYGVGAFLLAGVEMQKVK